MQPSIETEPKQDSEGRFEEVINGWCVLSRDNPADRDVEIKILEGGVGKTFVKFSGEGSRDTRDLVHFIVWGQ